MIRLIFLIAGGRQVSIFGCNKVHGWIFCNHAIGFQMITPSNEFCVAGPFKRDLTSHLGPITVVISVISIPPFIVQYIRLTPVLLNVYNDLDVKFSVSSEAVKV